MSGEPQQFSREQDHILRLLVETVASCSCVRLPRRAAFVLSFRINYFSTFSIPAMSVMEDLEDHL